MGLPIGVRPRAPGAAYCRNSFIPGTLVLMADGTTKPIEDVQVGDLVLATDPETGTTGPRPVAAIITGTGPKNLVEVTVTTGVYPAGSLTTAAVNTSGGYRPILTTGTIIATDNHPVWNVTDQTWTHAADLQAGLSLHTGIAVAATVISVTVDVDDIVVHNLAIAGIHTYYVLAGDAPVLVHNLGGDDRISGTIARWPHGMTIQIYANDHGPPHAHLKGRGFDIQIGQNGKPLDPNIQLNSRQQQFVNDNLKTLRNSLRAKMREHSRYRGGC